MRDMETRGMYNKRRTQRMPKTIKGAEAAQSELRKAKLCMMVVVDSAGLNETRLARLFGGIKSDRGGGMD
jgi:hypothetical protein